MPSARRLARYHPDFPTFDHVTPRSVGGSRTLDNGLLKHQRCNQARGNRPASGCDLLWQMVVVARLTIRPRSFKRFGKGGVRLT